MIEHPLGFIKIMSMIKSMTGYGKHIVQLPKGKVVIEIRSLNSKQLDINLRMPNIYKSKEIEIRNMAKKSLERGKIDISINVDSFNIGKNTSINEDVVNKYFTQMQEVYKTLDVEPNKNDIMNNIMKFPDILQSKDEELDENDWILIRKGIELALEKINDFRIQEGAAIIKDILNRVNNIKNSLAQVPQYEEQRVPTVKQRLLDKMNEWCDVKNIDEHRLEQEIVYYLEKLDITEEKVRLSNHCNYFFETVEKDNAPGRKLGFISQEMGREINTMGSKANNHDIQKLVVLMKDELEKIKEQSLNIL